MVLQCLMKPPFEPLATTSPSPLFKAFPVAITSSRRASELPVLHHDPPFLQFFRDKVVAYRDVSLTPKASSWFHVSQLIALPVFYLSPTSPLEMSVHSLDVRQADLLDYITPYTPVFLFLTKSVQQADLSPHNALPVGLWTLSCWPTRSQRRLFCLLL